MFCFQDFVNGVFLILKNVISYLKATARFDIPLINF